MPIDTTISVLKEVPEQVLKLLNNITERLSKENMEWLTVQFIVNNCISFAPLFSYGSTIYSIYRKKSIVGFSLDICCTMLVSSILRINFYFVEPFEITLLKQAIVMVIVQIGLLKVALHYKFSFAKSPATSNPNMPTNSKVSLHDHPPIYSEINKLFSNENYNFLVKLTGSFLIILKNVVRFFDPFYKRNFQFWQWTDESSYWKFISLFSIMVSLITCLFKQNYRYGVLIGFSSLLIESCLPLPQILLLNRIKTINGFKIIMLLSWYCGDLTKISYLIFGSKSISFIFVFFALFQMGLDIYIGFQYFYYKYFHTTSYKPEDLELQLSSTIEKEKK